MQRKMKKNLAEQEAYERIKRALIMKRFLPGQQLTEKWISENLNMSRTPIRSALKRLEQEGLIKMIPNRGAFVANPTKEEIIDAYNIRILLECYAIEQAIPHVKNKHILEMEELLEQEKKAYELRDFEMFISINDRIHRMPALISGNKILIRLVSTLITFGNCFLILKDNFYTNPIEKVKSIPEHRAILEALIDRDIEHAVLAVKRHLQTSMDVFIRDSKDSII